MLHKKLGNRCPEILKAGYVRSLVYQLCKQNIIVMALGIFE